MMIKKQDQNNTLYILIFNHLQQYQPLYPRLYTRLVLSPLPRAYILSPSFSPSLARVSSRQAAFQERLVKMRKKSMDDPILGCNATL
jgi:hypothetical protein